jgi:bla regulator protein BlaR1
VRQAERIVDDLITIDRTAGYSAGGEEHLTGHAALKGSAKTASAFPVFTAVLFLWLYGFSITSVFYRRRVRRYSVLIDKSSPVTDPEITGIVDAWRKRLKIGRSVRLVSSDLYLSPFTMGTLRPVIFFPRFIIDSGNSRELQAMLAHELAHIKRMDYFWIGLENIVLLLYYFFPPVWICKSRLNQARELMCDRMVLSTRTVSAESYGQSILSILRLNLYGRPLCSILPGFAGSRKVIQNRLIRLKGDHKMSKIKTVSIYCTCFLAGLFLLPMSEKDVNAVEIPDKGPEIYAEKVNSESESNSFESPMKTGHVSAVYGPMRDPFTKKQRNHKGIDIAAPYRTDVLATANGTVDSVRSAHTPGKGHGKLVLISHKGGIVTKYTQLDTIFVVEGQNVKKGQIIAGVGSSGRSTGPHLHFEILNNGVNVDPADYIDFSHLKKK